MLHTPIWPSFIFTSANQFWVYFREKNGHLFTYTDLLPITGPSTPIIGWVRGKSTTELNVRRPLRCERDFCSSGMLRSVDRLLGYRRFGTTYQVVLTAWPLEMGRIGFPETSVNYQSMLRNIPEERGSQNKTWCSETNESQYRWQVSNSCLKNIYELLHCSSLLHSCTPVDQTIYRSYYLHLALRLYPSGP